MLVRLLPDDIEKRWPLLKDALLKSLPAYTNGSADAVNNLLFALLDGTLQCWILVEYDEKEPVIRAVLTTTMIVDIPSGTKNLMIYSLTAFEVLSQEVLTDGYSALREFAKSNGCYKITAFTDIPRIIEMVKSVGGEASQTMIELEV